jgi:hypothetical protein
MTEIQQPGNPGVSIGVHLRARLARIAEPLGLSRSALVRIIIRHWLVHHEAMMCDLFAAQGGKTYFDGDKEE